MKMGELHAAMEQASRHLPLDEYHEYVGRHLEMIEAGAEMTARHANQMMQKPSFLTKAECHLDRAEEVLEAALAKVREARSIYQHKPQVAS